MWEGSLLKVDVFVIGGRIHAASWWLQEHTLRGSHYRLEREHGDAERVGVVECY